MSASWSYSLYKAVGTVIGTMLGGYLSMLVGVRSLFPSVATFLIVSSIAMLLQRKHTPLSHQLIFVVTGIVGKEHAHTQNTHTQNKHTHTHTHTHTHRDRHGVQF